MTGREKTATAGSRSALAIVLSDRRGGGLVQTIILLVALAIAGVGGVKALKSGFGQRSDCTGESIRTMTANPCSGATAPALPGAPNGSSSGTPGETPGETPVTLVSQPVGEPDGPALADAPTLEVLPFPGSVAVSCTAVKGADKTCKDRAGVRIQVTGEVSVERTPTKLDVKNGGCPLQEVSVSSKLQVELIGKFKGKVVGGSLAFFNGRVSKFSAKVAPDQADAIARGEREPPNPIDPTSLLPGESIELTEEFFGGNKQTGSFRQLQLEMGFEEGRKLSVGVKRLDANTVRVTVGDTDAVRRSLSLGVSESDLSLSLGGKEELSKGTVRSVDIDISTPEGFAAYQEFIATGKLPAPGTPGVKGSATTDVVEFTDSTRVEGKFQQVKVGGVVGDAEGVATETKRSDGSSDVVVSSRKNDVGFAIKESRAADGSTKTTFTLLLEGADPAKVKNFEAANGRSLGADESGNIRLDFTEADLENIRQQAIDQVLQAARQRGIDIDRAELERLLREDPNKLRRAGLGTVPAFEIAAAESPAEVLRQLALFGGLQGDPNRALDNLLSFINNTAVSRNGRGERPKDNPNSQLPGTPSPTQCK